LAHGAGPGVSGEEILYLQGQAIVKSVGAKETFAPSALELIGDWIVKRTAPK
jgi:hypothetical protein